ncbi:radical SAM PhpK family P-methyltransferase [Anaerobacterium chartisolvens]|uniref:Radical SAM PhpK family P-methyltransferase n=1 Tax=Anaerobacterium chartisolvens TaxID=1297424 RepID=A0A369BAD2_9FIRM|nr:PhpK family radical SAM P-methyltransferase [Anaerobacterium chartisolvens]RCX18361.1 radical SAM PhpK family P-methyltransferase [Anaerobacterium chartisolvens]
MNSVTDCILIGHNEMDFNTYADAVYALGKDSPAYRDLRLNFIWHKGERHTVTDILNKYSDSFQFHMGDVFSTTIAYLATYLHRRGFSYDYINDFKYEKEVLKEKLLSGNVMAVGITTTLYTSSGPINEICRFIRQYSKDVKIIIGGPYVLNLFFASQDQKTLQTFLKTTKADVLINSSQGEAALCNVLSAFKSGTSMDQIPNIAYWKDGTARVNFTEHENNKLDENTIDWNLFKEKVGKFVGVRTCLSCTFNCYFCGFNQRAGKHQMTSLEQVEKELDILESIGTVKSINFIDDTFNYPPDRFKELLRMIIRKNYSFKWNSYFRCQFADEEMVKLMEESGCEGVYLGIESANQKVLNNMRKGVTVEQYRKGISLLKKSHILIHTNFIVGFVGETKETLRDTVNFIKEFQPDFYRMQPWYFDRVTPIWKNRELFNIKGSNFVWSHDTMSCGEACGLIEEVLIEGIKESVWVPVHNFNLHNLYRLIHMGMSVDQVKGFLRGFTAGIKEGIQNPEKTEVSEEVISHIKKWSSKERILIKGGNTHE